MILPAAAEALLTIQQSLSSQILPVTVNLQSRLQAAPVLSFYPWFVSQKRPKLTQVVNVQDKICHGSGSDGQWSERKRDIPA